MIFMDDLAKRLANRVQLTSDGHKAYLEAVEGAFGSNIDYAMLVKVDGPAPEGQRRYSPARCIGAVKHRVEGNPDPNHVSTSFSERQNLSMRMGNRRMTRLTNAYSKKFRNHAAAMSLHVGFYNFCRVHETLRMTPAMAIGVTKHIWTIGELIQKAIDAPAQPPGPMAPATPPTLPRDPHTGLLAGRRPFKLRVIRGGKISPPRH